MQRRNFLCDGGRAALGFGVLFFAGCSSSTPNARRDPFFDSLITGWEAGIPQWLHETKMPAVSVAIIRDGQLAWRRAFGVRDAGTNDPADTDTVFAACSNAKPVFAYGVLKLCENGILNLDTPLTKYTKRRITNDSRIELITARHVLNHTTGFPNWRQGQELAIEFDPGSKFQYSGEGFSYLQSVVVELTGQPFETFMWENVLSPLGMTSSRVTWDANDANYERVVSHGHDADGKRIIDSVSTSQKRAEDLARYGAAAMLMTTPSDYATFLLEFLDPKPANAVRLNEASRREMLRPQVKKSEATWEGIAWALEQDDGGPMIFTHAGQAPGWYSMAAASTELRSGLMVMLNGDNYVPFLAKMLMDPAHPVPLERLWSDFAKRFFAM